MKELTKFVIAKNGKGRKPCLAGIRQTTKIPISKKICP